MSESIVVRKYSYERIYVRMYVCMYVCMYVRTISAVVPSVQRALNVSSIKLSSVQTSFSTTSMRWHLFFTVEVYALDTFTGS
jgi:hypothetical protein